MSARLEEMISGARELEAPWDVDRAERIREGTLRRRDVRGRRDRALRRGLLVASGAGLMVLALLRAASSAPAERELTTASSNNESPVTAPAPAPAPMPAPEALAARAMSDAGYARD